MSRSPLPFLPLTAPRVETGKPPPAEPINWFQELAPRLDQVNGSVPITEASPVADGEACSLVFRDMDEIAQQERSRRQHGLVEPPEITKMRRQAAEEAQRLIEQAIRQAEILEQQAREQGYQQGYAKGYADGQQEATQSLFDRANEERAAFIEDITRFLEYAETQRQQAWEAMEPQILSLIFELSQKVIKQEIEATRTIAVTMIRNVLRRVNQSQTLRIRVHPDDLDMARANREEILTMLDGIPHIEIIADRRVDEGGCIVDTDSGSIDARIGTQLSEIAETIRQINAQRDQAA